MTTTEARSKAQGFACKCKGKKKNCEDCRGLGFDMDSVMDLPEQDRGEVLSYLIPSRVTFPVRKTKVKEILVREPVVVMENEPPASKVETQAEEEPQPEVTQLGLDWGSIRPELESRLKTDIDPDDPVRMNIEVFAIMLERMGDLTAQALAKRITVNCEAFDLELKQRREDHHRDIMTQSVLAREQINAATKDSVVGIKNVTADLTKSAMELQAQDRHMRAWDWFLGFVFAVALMAFSFVVGRYAK